jgi:hypothetical protein
MSKVRDYSPYKLRVREEIERLDAEEVPARIGEYESPGFCDQPP